jgi:hypothetical protein
MKLDEITEAEEVWAAILEVLAREPSSTVIQNLAAGPLEDLLEYWGPVFIDRVEVEARRNPSFRHLLGGVWQCSTPEVWQRIQKVRGAAW